MTVPRIRTSVPHVSSVSLALVLMFTACTSGPETPQAPTSGPTPGPTPVPISMASARRCPVTIPHGPAPSARTYGNGKLRVGLWPRGVIEVGPAYVDREGRVRMKFPWWRMVRGRLRITGRRIDGAAPPVRAHVPRGYGPTGFQASGVTFPTEGCWELTGTVGRASLTFVTYVIKRRRASTS